MIQKKQNKAIKVLTGSANFSLRGLYVQANSILIFNNDDIANLYEQAFETAFNAEDSYKAVVSSPISSRWYDLNSSDNIPKCSVSFSPHKISTVSLGKVSDAINSANSSVFFAIMEMSGKGSVMESLEKLAGETRHARFWYYSTRK